MRDPAVPSVSHLINNTSLTIFACHEILLTQDMIAALTLLPDLGKLDITLLSTHVWTCLEATSPFPRLQALELRAHPTTLIPFARAFPMSSVREAMFKSEEPALAPQVPGIFIAVHEQFSPPVLESIVICYVYREPTDFDEGEEPRLSSFHLRPFLKFHNQRELDISIEACRYSLDDSILDEFATAFPRLRSLSVGEDEYSTWDTIPSITALAPFASQCEDLEKLGLRLGADGLWIHPSEGFPQPRNIGAWEDVQSLLRWFRLIWDDERRVGEPCAPLSEGQTD
ncbi:hypothetical protein C8T65DRAFT_826409 [Cerioporus squamosus]|nr:hypothetical protein C8T65DRAFT_826409 [Cerioporus squamosus]